MFKPIPDSVTLARFPSRGEGGQQNQGAVGGHPVDLPSPPRPMIPASFPFGGRSHGQGAVGGYPPSPAADLTDSSPAADLTDSSDSESEDFVDFTKYLRFRPSEGKPPKHLFPEHVRYSPTRGFYPPVPPPNPDDLIPSGEGCFRVVHPRRWTLLSHNPKQVFVTRVGNVNMFGDPNNYVTFPNPMTFPGGGSVTILDGGYMGFDEPPEPRYSIPSFGGCNLVVPVGGTVTFCRNLEEFLPHPSVEEDYDVNCYGRIVPAFGEY